MNAQEAYAAAGQFVAETAEHLYAWSFEHPFYAMLSTIVLLCLLFGSKRVLGTPVAIGLILLIIAELVLYFITRHVVYLTEVIFSGISPLEVAKLKTKIKDSKSFDEWQKNSTALDTLEGRDKWKEREDSTMYDWKWVKHVTEALREEREANNVTKLMSYLQMCLRKNLGGIMKEELYSLTHAGTKKLIEDYVKEIQTSLEYLSDVPDHVLSDKEKLRFFYAAFRSFGNTALCLSGGAGLGKYHFGVVRALLEAGKLPRIISGTSAGAVIAAVTCTRTDEELLELFTPDSEMQPNLNSFTDSWFSIIFRFLRTGGLYCKDHWHSLLQWHSMGLTFQEAFERTGRILNITTTVLGRDETLVLNHLTTPNVLISSAVLASSAVPGFLAGVQLYEKDPQTKEIYPHHWSDNTKLMDGTFSMDIPSNALSEMFNVHFFVVSQVNPHVIPFFYNNRGECGSPSIWRKRTGGWRGGFLFSLLELLLKNDLKKNVRLVSALGLVPKFMGNDWSDVWVQDGDFQGHCTITPKATFWDYLKLVSDPSREEFADALNQSLLRTWEKFSMMDKRFIVGNTLKKCLHDILRKSPRRSFTMFNAEVIEEEQGLSFAFPQDIEFTSSTFMVETQTGKPKKIPVVEGRRRKAA